MTKRKLNKLNLTILILSIILIIILSIIIINIITKPKLTKEEKLLQEKLEILNNVDQKINYFNYNNIDRYIEYKKKNKKLSNKKIVLYVNINLDKEPYKDAKETTYLYKNYILLNKYNLVSKSYKPKNLVQVSTEYAKENILLTEETKNQFILMAEAAKKENLTLYAISGYRDYTYQENLYNNYYSIDGNKANEYSSKPGHSEHHTGLAIDISNKTTSYEEFDKTEEFKWMQENAHKYGFILRYPEDKTNETLYQYEPWHYRYVGIKISTYIKKHNISFEEYYVKHIEK